MNSSIHSVWLPIILSILLVSNLVIGQNVRQAVCNVQSGSGVGQVTGSIILNQPTHGSNVTLVIKLTGLNPTGLHGFHVHANSSLGSQCSEAAGHLNNLQTLHGAPYDPIDRRHTGDLGNIRSDVNGVVDITISDWVIELNGVNSIIGKPIVIHELEDDLGRGNASTSNTTGNAGARVGCCLIAESTGSIVPLNTVAIVGQSVLLQCRHTSQQIAWTFIPAGTGSSSIIAVDCAIVGAVRDDYDVDTTDGACNLIVNSVTEQLAGTYTCQDTATTDRVVSAELIAIESDPVCSQSSTGPSIPAGTPVQFSCTFHYTGAIKPRMDWTDSFSNSVPPTIEHVNTTIIQSTVIVTAASPVLSQYICQTTFNAPTDVPPSHIDPATNVPEYSNKWTSTEVPVNGLNMHRARNMQVI